MAKQNENAAKQQQNEKPVAPATAAIRAIPSDETFSPSNVADVEKNVVQSHISVSKGRNEQRYELNVTFDFSGVTQKELLELAVRDRVIAIQRDWRKMFLGSADEKRKALDPSTFKHVNVRTMLDTEPRRADPITKAKTALSKLLANMSDDERKALLAELGKAQ